MKTLFNIAILLFLAISTNAHAQEAPTQTLTLASGWNIISTPKVLLSHSFSAAETSDNFDIYLLDASEPTGWATMADLGQSEFEPLYGYLVNNKTNSTQTLTLNYATNLLPNQKIFDRTFTTAGWYSIGIANKTYARTLSADYTDTNNPSSLLSLLSGHYDLFIDFTDAAYGENRKSVALTDPWKVVLPSDINTLNDFREGKGYVTYIKDINAQYAGFQSDPAPDDAEDGADEIIVKTSSEDPDATTLKVEDDSKSDWLTVFMFDLDTDDSVNNIELHTVQVTIVTSAAYNTVVDDAELVIDGVTVDTFDVSSTTATTTTLTFNVDGDVTVDAGDRVAAELKLRFKALASEGTTVQASVTGAAAVKGEGADDVDSNGSAVGDTHTLRSEGILVALEDDSANVTTGDNAGDDYATYKLVLEVVAFEQDVFINTNETTSVDAAVVNSAGNPVAGTSTVVIDSSADIEGGSFKINEGDTETITITATFDAASAGTAARFQLDGLTFGEYDGANDQTWVAFPASEYRTDIVTLVN